MPLEYAMLEFELKCRLQAPIDLRKKHVDQSEQRIQPHTNQRVHLQINLLRTKAEPPKEVTRAHWSSHLDEVGGGWRQARLARLARSADRPMAQLPYPLRLRHDGASLTPKVGSRRLNRTHSCTPMAPYYK